MEIIGPKQEPIEKSLHPTGFRWKTPFLWLGEQVDNLLNSMNLKDEGWSFRKLGALHAIWVAIYISIKHVDITTFITTILIWLAFAAICMGLTTFTQLLDLWNRKQSNP